MSNFCFNCWVILFIKSSKSCKDTFSFDESLILLFILLIRWILFSDKIISKSFLFIFWDKSLFISEYNCRILSFISLIISSFVFFIDVMSNLLSKSSFNPFKNSSNFDISNFSLSLWFILLSMSLLLYKSLLLFNNNFILFVRFSISACFWLK